MGKNGNVIKADTGLHNKEEAVDVGLGEVGRIDELQRQLCSRERRQKH